jgi:DNA-binding beta-propeller fold protein YncE
VLGASASAAGKEDPLFIFPDQAKYRKEIEENRGSNGPPPTPPFLEDPCGLAAGAAGGGFYVSEYYRHTIKKYGVSFERGEWVVGDSGQRPEGVISNVDPLGGPCGLAISKDEDMYVNDFHHDVFSFSMHSTLPLPADPAHHRPTGVAVDPVTENVYVDYRTFISVFDPTGQPVMTEGEPMRIGVGSLGDGYGVAVSAIGRVYVADASTKTVKVYNPAGDLSNPVATIKGPGKGFNSLRDSAVAVDRITGAIYVVDNLEPIYAEEPEAVIDVFHASNVFLGVLKYRVYDGLPPALTVDNSETTSQGRVYVGSGDSGRASVYAYGPGAETAKSLPPTAGLTVTAPGAGTGGAPSSGGGTLAAAAGAPIPAPAPLAAAATTSIGGGAGEGHRHRHRHRPKRKRQGGRR